jgi:predicted phosphodiesterase
MPRLWILSDLHQEIDSCAWKPSSAPEHDIVVLAGDVAAPPTESYRYALENFDKPVLFVAGNHEYYSQVMPRVQAAARLEAPGYEPHLFHLENRSVVVEGVRFVGCTLWTNFELFGPASLPYALNAALRGLNDFSMIAAAEPVAGKALRFLPEMSRDIHLESLAWMEKELAVEFDGPTVVVTHHAPAPGSIHPKWEGSVMNPCFASDLTRTIETFQPDLWIHGHVHDSFDYTIGRTRVVANPKGYGNENAKFDPHLTIDV